MIPEPAVLVVSDDDGRVGPQRTGADFLHQRGDVLVAGHHVGISGVLIEVALRLVERDLGQGSIVDRG